MTYDYKKQYPYKIGSIVHWGTKSGKVTELPGPYSVVVDNRITVPVSLITKNEKGKPDEPKPKTKTRNIGKARS
jgi:hypothetical protein